jgi:MFS family permease
MAFGGIIVYASTKSIFKFTLPYFFIFADLDSYWVYGVVLFQQIFHMMGLSLIAKKSKKRNGYFLGMGILFSLTLIFLFNISIIIVVIMNIIAGLCIGIMQGAVQRIILDHSKAKDSQLYTMWGEVFMGISFGIMPIIAGVLTEIDLRYDFLFLAILLIVLGFILVLKQIKFYRQEKDGNDS